MSAVNFRHGLFLGISVKRVSVLTTSSFGRRVSRQLVKVFATAPRATEARQFHLLKRELVVIGQFLAATDRAQCKDDNVLAAVDKNHLRVAVGITRVVDKPRSIPHHCRVNDVIGVLTEHVTADASRLIIPLSLISQR